MVLSSSPDWSLVTAREGGQMISRTGADNGDNCPRATRTNRDILHHYIVSVFTQMKPRNCRSFLTKTVSGSR